MGTPLRLRGRRRRPSRPRARGDPVGPRKKERDASSAQLPKPLHSDRSISMRYTTLSFRGWDERAPRGGGDHRTDRSAVEAESPGLAAVGSGRQAVHGGEGEDEVRGPVQAPPVCAPRCASERERRVDGPPSARRRALRAPSTADGREPGRARAGCRSRCAPCCRGRAHDACASTAPSPSMARKRWRSATVAAFSAVPNGRDFSTSPASTDEVSNA
jgi:hypothetical protein